MTGGLLVLGGAGMLGHKMFQVLGREFPETLCTLRGSLEELPGATTELFRPEATIPGIDVSDAGRLAALLRERRPAVIVNCAGVVKQRPTARDAIPSISVNALLPHQLAAWSREWGGRVIHFSTDCVFSGSRGGYREDDLSDAEDLYGKSKFLGEVASENAVTLRTSIIGRELTGHRSLLDWFLSQKGKRVRGFRKVIYSGITTNEMANVVSSIIRSFPTLSGLFQVVSDPISKYDLLLLIREAYGLEVDVEPDDKEVSDRSMSGEKFQKATGWRSPSWPDMVLTMAADPTRYEAWGVSVR